MSCLLGLLFPVDSFLDRPRGWEGGFLCLCSLVIWTIPADTLEKENVKEKGSVSCAVVVPNVKV